MKQLIAVACVLAAVALMAEAKPPSKMRELLKEITDYIKAEESEIQQRYVYRLDRATSTTLSIRLGRSMAQNAMLSTCTFLVKYRPVGEDLYSCYPATCSGKGWNSESYSAGSFELTGLTPSTAYEVKDEMYCGGVEQAQSSTVTYSTTA